MYDLNECIDNFIQSLDSKDKCFEEHKNSDGKCYGLSGDDSFFDYLSYECLGCNKLTFDFRKENR